MYYRGDYYRGDPGFLSFLRGVGSSVAGMIPGIGGFASKAISRIPLPVKKITSTAIELAKRNKTLTAAAGAAGVAGTLALSGKRAGSSMTPAAMGGMSVRGVRGLAGSGRHRRMHVTNVKALKRSLRRIKGFEKIARHVLHFTKPGHALGHAKFKFTRKKRF